MKEIELAVASYKVDKEATVYYFELEDKKKGRVYRFSDRYSQIRKFFEGE